MHSFLIIGADQEQRREKALVFAKIHNISQFDQLVVQPIKESNSIGINQVRELKAKILLKPLNSTFKLALLFNFEKATQEAQNALLKTLEEPPADTIIVLTASNKDLLLPTVVSRCSLIQLSTINYQLSTAELSVLSSQFSALFNGGVGDKLVLAQEVSKNKEEVISWLKKMILFTRQKLIDNLSLSQYLNLLISLQKSHVVLSTTNISPRFVLENFFLSF